MGKSGRKKLSILARSAPYVRQEGEEQFDISPGDVSGKITEVDFLNAISKLFITDEDQIEDPERTTQLLLDVVKSGKYHEIVSKLNSNDIVTQTAALGTLKNMILVGSQDFIVVLKNDNVANNLMEIFSKLPDNSSHPINHLLYELFTLSTLFIEEMPETIPIFSSQSILQYIVLFLSADKVNDKDRSYETYSSILEFLYTLSEENQSVISLLSDQFETIYSWLTKLANPLCQVYTVGILFNLYQLQLLTPRINTILDPLIMIIKPDNIRLDGLYLELISLTFEILANILVLQVENDLNDYEWELSDINEGSDIYVPQELQLIYDYLSSSSLFIYLYQFSAKILSPDFPQIHINLIIEHILSLYINIFENLNINIVDSNTTDLSNFFFYVLNYIVTNNNNDDSLSLVLSTAWSFFRKLVQLKFNTQIKNEIIINVINQHQNPTVQSYAVGILGCILQMNNSDEEYMKVLLNSLQNQSLLVNTEAINSIIDIFSDDIDYPLWNKLNILSLLEKNVSFLQKKIKDNAKNNNIDIMRAKEIFTNLKRFIQYKKTH